MNTRYRYSACLALAWAAAGTGASAQSQYVEVPVTDVQPLVRLVTQRIPHERCYEQPVEVRRAGPHSATPGLVGALVGGTVAGALGHNSRSQPVIAGVGALVGASVGTDIAHRQSTTSYYSTRRRCEVDYELRDREDVTGYRVSYQYGGNIYHTRTDYHPGNTIRLRVDLHPVH